MANHSKTGKAKSTQRLYCKQNRRKLGFREIKRCKKDSRKAIEVKKRGRRGDG